MLTTFPDSGGPFAALRPRNLKTDFYAWGIDLSLCSFRKKAENFCRLV